MLTRRKSELSCLPNPLKRRGVGAHGIPNGLEDIDRERTGGKLATFNVVNLIASVSYAKVAISAALPWCFHVPCLSPGAGDKRNKRHWRHWGLICQKFIKKSGGTTYYEAFCSNRIE